MCNLLRYEGKQAPLFYFHTFQSFLLHVIPFQFLRDSFPDTISNHQGSYVILNAENGGKITLKKDYAFPYT